MTVISRKHQVTLPVDSMREAGLEAGDELRVRVLGPGRLELVRVDDLVAQFAGVFGEEVYPRNYLDRLRRDWP